MGVEVLAQRVNAGETLAIAGPAGTELPRHGIDTPAPLYSANALFSDLGLAALATIHNVYSRDADILPAASFGVRSSLVLAENNIDPDRARLATVQACHLVLDAAARATSLRGVSVVPVGTGGSIEDCYRPKGALSGTQLLEAQRTHVRNLMAGGISAVWDETVPTGEEAWHALLAAEQEGLDVAGLSFYVEGDANGVALPSGETLSEVLPRLLKRFRFLFAGVNCAPGDATEAAVDELRGLTDRPLVAYPNGLETPPHDDPDVFALHLRANRQAISDTTARLIALGARVVGGCCATGPDHLADTRNQIDSAAVANLLTTRETGRLTL